MAVLAHPDDESLGVGGTLAKYAAEGADVFLLTATRGDAGGFRGHRRGDEGHPGPQALGTIREAELRAAAAVLGLRDVALLDYHDQQLDRAEPSEAVSRIAAHLRRVRPDVVITFGPDGAYGHPDRMRDLAVHRRGGRRCGRRRGRDGERGCWCTPTRCLEALLHRVGGVDMDCVPGGGPDAVGNRRRS